MTMDHPTVTAMLEAAAAKAEQSADPDERVRARMIREALADAALLRSYVESMREWVENANAYTDEQIANGVAVCYPGGIGAFIHDEADARYLRSTEDRMQRLLRTPIRHFEPAVTL